ncbi:MAG: hypothetical protein EOM25_01740 [Deltaproteobacteria bacterium]|nr:hypothetical protein [Deltaproteobacteria bacterium]
MPKVMLAGVILALVLLNGCGGYGRGFNDSNCVNGPGYRGTPSSAASYRLSECRVVKEERIGLFEEPCVNEQRPVGSEGSKGSVGDGGGGNSGGGGL